MRLLFLSEGKRTYNFDNIHLIVCSTFCRNQFT